MRPAFCGRARRLGPLAIALAALFWTVGAQVQAQSDPAFGGRYVSADGVIGVDLDRSGEPPLLRFDGSPEILVLTARPATRGDVVFRDDTGRPVLRVTPFGGATLFGADAPRGLPLIRQGPAKRLGNPQADAMILAQEAESAESLIEALYGQDFALHMPPIGSGHRGSANLVASVQNLRIALSALSNNSDARTAVRARMEAARFVAGDRPTVVLKGRVLEVRFRPNGGPDGRLSSAALVRFLEGAL